MAENRKRKFWGWGYEDQGPTPEQQKHMAERMAKRFGLGPLEITPPPKESELNLRAPRVKPPAALEAICTTAVARARGPHATARDRAISGARFGATIRIRSTWSRFRAMRRN